MPRSRTTEPGPRGAGAPDPAPIVVDANEFDEALGVYTLFLVIPRSEAAYFQIVVESWENVAVARTVERFWSDGRDGRDAPPPGRRRRGAPTRCLVVAVAAPDFVETCSRRLARLCAEVGGEQVRTTPQLREALRRDLVDDPLAAGA